jgi:hypothetical protein
MFKISAISKYKNLNGNTKLYYILGLASVVSIFSFIVYQNIFVTIVMMGCGIVAYLMLSRVPKKIIVEMNDETIIIDEQDLSWKQCLGWGMVDLGDMSEVTIQTSDLLQPFVNFYFTDNQPGVKEFIVYISQHCTYSKEIPDKNMIMKFLRTFDLM